jgi:hypothetical protein
MPRKQKFKPQDKTFNIRYNNNPYFYKRSVSQNDNDLKYNAFIRELRLEYRNLRKENLDLKNQLTLKIKTLKEQKVENEMQRVTIDLLKSENELRKEEIDLMNEEKEILIKDNSTLKDENEKLKEQIKIYSEAIVIYQNEMAMKISGQVKPEIDSFFLNFF